MIKVIYMGTPDFAVPPLKSLAASDECEVMLVVTQPDKAKDRGKKVLPPEVKTAAIEAGLRVAQPEKVKNNPEFIDELRALSPDVIIVAAYGKILPPELLAIPRCGCINIHASLLPRFRGAAPIHRSIMAGDKETGVTLMYMEEGLDTGDMIARASTQIGSKTLSELHDELSLMGADLLMEWLPRIVSGDISPEKQDDSLSCYAPMITKEEGHIDFTSDASAAERLVRAMPDKPGAYAFLGEDQMKVRKSELVPGETDAEPGTIINIEKNRIDVAFGHGILGITAVQMPGKKTMSAGDFLRGHALEKGTVLR